MSSNQQWFQLLYCATHAKINDKAPTGFLVLVVMKLIVPFYFSFLHEPILVADDKTKKPETPG